MKAQYWSMDMVFALLIFTSAILILASVWSRVNSEFSLAYGFGVGNMQAQLQGLEQRIFSPGFPQNWNAYADPGNSLSWNNVTIGLGAGNSSIISGDKALALMAMSNTNYQATKQMLGVGYDYFITIDSYGNYNISIGSNPLTRNATAIQSATIPVILSNGATGTMRVMVWTNTSFGVS
ncbi:MAG: hypothetical protein KGH64_06215 [Candidatus Micrarchaeota archaeon]|nr:hypothetical protein [Candidatus Micrarchaeota archaeon]MDE1859383.1 hypothetical protein [Candidatus Micrarchaeota archaeon]